MDRTVAGGELGLEGKSLANVDTLFVRAPGVKYEVHGVRPNIVPLMIGLDVDATDRAAAQAAAERHATMLSGVHAVGYDTPGWGFGEKDGERHAGADAGDERRWREDFDVPFVVDRRDAACRSSGSTRGRSAPT